MHISEGVLSGQVLVAGGVLAAAGTAIGLKKMDYERVAEVGILASAFFVASLINVRIGVSSAHLILNGILGLLLGWAAFPAIFVALILQAVLFQFGGITVLGVNTVIMALPSVICYYLFSNIIFKSNSLAITAAFLGGFLSVLFSGLLLGVALIFTEESFFEMVLLIVGANFPVMVIEGIVTAFCVMFLRKVRPEMLPGYVK
ncbi:MAG: cobalt transporter CbiM [Proteobacteria bacterium]|nr:cobalt transporter CbiM [Pseudomonadota bacterium]